MTEAEQLSQLCARLGAPPAQAATMAAERGTTREAELTRLLDIVVKGRAGEVPADFTPPSRPPV